ncbi:hypothetical protein Vadar_001589 [Vaccinium darrowii]|uniref:Uncharacterized protein n=1 Tax=Vaccinium darrowii TaxID=229202 RepID=A0ACB7XET6_9ERIC|nr:hypothetical protein Vadar_001589 [Vaccinium darrowii]
MITEALEAIEKLQKNADTLIVIPNDGLLLLISLAPFSTCKECQYFKILILRKDLGLTVGIDPSILMATIGLKYVSISGIQCQIASFGTSSGQLLQPCDKELQIYQLGMFLAYAFHKILEYV